MITKLFCVHDSKVGAYMTPFFMRSKGEALRAWATTVNDDKTQFCKFPGDFTLFEIGEFDDEKGEVRAYDVKVSLGTGLEFKKQEVTPLRAVAETKGE